jgi:hypothetical protein
MIALLPAAAPAAQPGGGGGACCGRCGQASPAAPAASADAKPEADAPPATTPGRGAMGMTAEEHGNVFDLLSGHAAIARQVEAVPGGVKTTTTTTTAALVPVLRAHVRQMKAHLEEGRPVRLWDPVFRNVFANAKTIKLEFKDIDGGIEVVETSDDPAAAEAVRAHAMKVNAFVSGGHAAARPPWAGGGMRMRGGR